MNELHQGTRSGPPDQKTLPGLPPVPHVTGPAGSPSFPVSLDSYISVQSAQSLYRLLLDLLWIDSPSMHKGTVEWRSFAVLHQLRAMLSLEIDQCNVSHDLRVLVDRLETFLLIDHD